MHNGHANGLAEDTLESKIELETVEFTEEEGLLQNNEVPQDQEPPQEASNSKEQSNRRIPIYIWMMLFLALLAVSSAASAFKALDAEVLMKATWRLQLTSFLLLGPCIYQCYQMQRDTPHLWLQLWEYKSMLHPSSTSLTVY